MTRRLALTSAFLLTSAFFTSAAQGAILITEWMYNGTDGEFVEFTNVGSSAVDMTGWSFDDSSQLAGAFSLSGLGVVQPNESVILTDADAAAFRTSWGLAPTVKIIGGNSQNLSRSDEINLYDAGNMLIDRLTFNDQGTGNVAGPRANNVSGNPTSLAVLGANNASSWILSVAGDSFSSVASLSGNLGNPGAFTLVPEPSAVVVAACADGRRRAMAPLGPFLNQVPDAQEVPTHEPPTSVGGASPPLHSPS